ncbi:DUF1330 domain-containing protein [Aurantiacibacter poecillastricola]|uniref:DUF1330 domain-containing protein n=1 Tax=Aurantiacibacter poecillastricola TaxID=3064385 RepID=UPI00274008D0|nr:DUF1330 domain-containing protein [Aurantiacibacter sp. 219JJ12-13]MDP5259979.1 DUF1330 domain-containing protein [Aurantiacibacter sp. 219JJ12-13]
MDHIMTRSNTFALALLLPVVACSPVSQPEVAANAPAGPNIAKAYVVAEINVTDLEAYRQYVQAAFPVIESYGGRFLTRGGTTVHIEGLPPAERVMIIEFESLDRAKEFEYSQAYRDIAPLRHQAAESRLFIIEGAADVASAAP